MLVVGWRTGANEFEASRAISKHMGCDSLQAKILVEKIFDGKSVELPNNATLKESLKNLKFVVR